MNTQEQRYREEFEKLIVSINENISYADKLLLWQVYLAGRKAREEEIGTVTDGLKSLLKISNEEISQLKAENERLEEQVRQLLFDETPNVKKLRDENDQLMDLIPPHCYRENNRLKSENERLKYDNEDLSRLKKHYEDLTIPINRKNQKLKDLVKEMYEGWVSGEDVVTPMRKASEWLKEAEEVLK